MKGQFGNLVNWALIVAGLAGIIYPAFLDPPRGLTEIFVSLFRPDLSLPTAMRYLALLVFVASVYILILRAMFREKPVTVISTHIRLAFTNSDPSIAKMDRMQLLRANRNDVTAYHMNVAPSHATGKVKKDAINMQSFCRGTMFNDYVDADGTESSGFDIIHEFGTKLPYSYMLPMLPNWLIMFLVHQENGWVERYVVKRRSQFTYENEFNHESPVLDLSSSRYPHHNITIQIIFNNDKLPSSIKSHLIKSNAVTEAQIERQTETTYVVKLDKLHGEERIRIRWKW